MPKRYIQLTSSEKEKLESEVRIIPNFRIQGVKLCYGVTAAANRQGKNRTTIAEMLDVYLDTGSDWFNSWLEKKLVSLSDLPKSVCQYC